MSSRWLFRQGALILGPLDKEQLEQRILEGELGEDIEAKELGGEAFRPLREIGVFAVALAKAKAKRRVEVLSEKRATAKRKRRLIAAAGVLVLLLLSSIAVFYISTDLAKSKTTEPTDSLAFADFGSDVVSIRRSPKEPSKETDPLLSYQDSNKLSGGGRRVAAEGGSKGASGWVDDITTDIQWNPDSIKQVLDSNQRRLLSCLQNNVKTVDGWNRGDLVKIPIGFTISNNGRVNNLWVEHARYKGKELESCLLQEMGKWPFAPYDGDQAVVNWSISWKVRS
ncbi:MAG: AgmX/PglI C-terminal domain-containing protein [Cystobacterineae bacterium]|nr:AgmX/PglI C-terminal domain-containing protein [Cystobacterineae bacterium]